MGCLEAVAGPGGYVERAARQGASSSLSRDRPPALTPRHPAALALSHPGTSTSNPRGHRLLLEQADKPTRKGTAARTPSLPPRPCRGLYLGQLWEEGLGLTPQTPAGPAPAPSPLGSHSAPSPSHVTPKPPCLFIPRPGYVTSHRVNILSDLPASPPALLRLPSGWRPTSQVADCATPLLPTCSTSRARPLLPPSPPATLSLSPYDVPRPFRQSELLLAGGGPAGVRLPSGLKGLWARSTVPRWRGTGRAAAKRPREAGSGGRVGRRRAGCGLAHRNSRGAEPRAGDSRGLVCGGSEAPAELPAQPACGQRRPGPGGRPHW